MSDPLERFVDHDLDWLEEVQPAPKQKFNPYHEPGGSPEGGQFAHGPGGGGGGVTEGPYGTVGGTKIGDFAQQGIHIDSYTATTSPAQQKEFLQFWDRKIGKSPAEFKKEYFAGGDGSMSIEYSPYDKSMNIDAFLHEPRTRDQLAEVDETYHFDQAKTHFDYFRVSSGKQGEGVMKPIIASAVERAQKMGFKKIDLLANIDVGGYAWARYGFVPTEDEWRGLSRSLEYRIRGLGSGDDAESYEASSWDELTDTAQRRIEESYYRSTFTDYHTSEIDSWRDSGQDLEDAKNLTVESFNLHTADEWAEDAIKDANKERVENGKQAYPFSTDTLLQAIKLDFSSKYGDGRGDVEVEFDDSKLTNPVTMTPEGQKPLPGIPEPEPHEHLTQDMRDEIEKALSNAFDTEAENKRDQMDPPDYLTSNAEDFQREMWDQMSDEEKYAWARRNASDYLGGETQGYGSGEISKEDTDRLMKLAQSDDPKSVWGIADSKYGFKLLGNMNWNGELKFGDKQSMDRFHAYISAKKAKAA